MTRKKISQREAQRLRRRVRDLEDQISRERSHYVHDYPGPHLCSLDLVGGADIAACVRTARKLGHGVAVTVWDKTQLRFFAVRRVK